MGDKNNNPIMYIFRQYDDLVAIGSLSTRYFVELGKSVFFGIKGHAAIVDHKGNVLAHPLDSWIQARKSIAKVSAVQRMLTGKTGVEIFYSPALKGDMIAGITAVKGTGWGVMVPQPISELYQKAEAASQSALTIFVTGLAIALTLAILISRSILKPMQRLVDAYQQISNGSLNRTLSFETRWYIPIEFKKMQISFNTMVSELDQNIRRIKAMAYIDPVTGSFNRRAFSMRVENQLEIMQSKKLWGTILYFDLDGFKKVNDTHGHDAGDALLKEVIVRTGKVLMLQRESDLNVSINDEDAEFERRKTLKPMVARLGGDEFAVFLPCVYECDDIGYIVEEFYTELSQPFVTNEQSVHVGASIGIVRFPIDGVKLEMLLKRADLAMYTAKKANKNTFRYYVSEMEATDYAGVA